MNNGETTGYRVYSLGIVAEDKDNDGDYIKVTPIEDLPFAKGRLSETEVNYNVKGKDHLGVDVSADVKGVMWVDAQWQAMMGDNRQTAPNVREGETVLIWKYGSEQKHYWTEFERTPALRRLENVIRAYSNLSKKGETFDLESSYWTQFSTRDKIVKLHTSNNDGEPVTYDVTIDTGNGTFQVIDSNKNEMVLDSVNNKLTLNIMDTIEFNAPKIIFNGQEYVRTNAPEITETGDNITNKASASHDIESGGSAMSNAAGSNTVKAGADILVQGQEATIQATTPVNMPSGINA